MPPVRHPGILPLDPFSCWKGLAEEQRQRRTAVLMEDIEAEAAARRKKQEGQVSGRRRF